MLTLKSGEKLNISRSRREEFERFLLRLRKKEKRGEEEKEKYYLELEDQNRKYHEILYELNKNIAIIDLFYEQADYDEMKRIIKKLKEIMRMTEI